MSQVPHNRSPSIPAFTTLPVISKAEWTFVQRVIQGTVHKFSGIRDAMQITFLPYLLQDKLADDDRVR
jgi:hypothetical protein